MANVIKLKRGTSTPTTSNIVDGEVAIDKSAKKFFLNDGGTIKEIGGIPDSSVTSAKIADDAVTSSKIAANAVTDSELANGSVIESILANNAVVTAKIQDGAVTSAKIADGAIVNADINASAAIDVSKLSGVVPLAGGTMTGMLVVADTIPRIRLQDTNNNPDYELNDTNGVFNIRDNSNATDRFSIGTDGTVDVAGNLDVGAGLDVTGDITGTGGLTLTSTDTGSSAAPELELYRNSSSPADADYLGQLKFTGESDDGSKEVYAKITGKIGDASSGTEDGIIEFAHRKAGSNVITARFTSTSLKLINGTELEAEGGATITGTCTATTFSGSGASLTNLPAGQLTGTLPAIDGSNLTNLPASGGPTGGGSDKVFTENAQTVTTDYTIGDTFGAACNAMAAGPITINSGVTVQVNSGETLTIV